MKIDLAEKFPHLLRAPIVEAVMDFRAKPSIEWDHEGFQERLKNALNDYPTIQPQRIFQEQYKAESGKLPQQQITDLGWGGLLFRSQDKSQVAQFQKGGFAFSRLRPYQTWEEFEAEALRLWKVYAQLTHPMTIQRIGVRFVNQMPVPADSFSVEEYLADSPQPLRSSGLLRGSFLHQDTLLVPDTNYLVNLIRTIQTTEGTPPRIPIILDIDVFANVQMELDDSALKMRLAEMRWLKNKAFFGSITEKSKGLFS